MNYFTLHTSSLQYSRLLQNKTMISFYIFLWLWGENKPTSLSVLHFCFSALALQVPSADLCFQSKGPCNSPNSRLQTKEQLSHWSSLIYICCKYGIAVLTPWTQGQQKDCQNKLIFCEMGGRWDSLDVAYRIKH